MKTNWLEIHNSEARQIRDIPQWDFDFFREEFLRACREGSRVCALCGVPFQHDFRLIAVLASDANGILKVAGCKVGKEYPALTPDCPQVHLFEREIAETWGVRPAGHPWLKSVRVHPGGIPQAGDFFRMEGQEVHEVAVGPVHAGVIEPGHFRFQCHGETVHHLEIALGYQHRGAEKRLCGGPDPRTIHYMETLAGDTTVGHATAYCQAVEALSGSEVPARAQVFRAVALELERLANHTGDLGALAGDVGFLPTASYCGRLRGDFLNMTALVCGNRFGRGWLAPGGVNFNADGKRIRELIGRLKKTLRDVRGAAELLWESSSVLARFEDTGVLTHELCESLGIVGPAARASGLIRDVRADFPAGFYRFAQIPVSTCSKGDVFSRAYVRWLEIQRSAGFILNQLELLADGEDKNPLPQLQPSSVVVSLAEGWRGEICHVAWTDAKGHFAHYKVVDPSFHNWTGLAMVLRGEGVSDFPLCNKSFNLSYCGFDL